MLTKERVPYAYETLTVPSNNTVLTLTRSVYDRGGQPPIEALVTINPGAPVSYLLISTVAVTTAVGHKVSPYGSLILFGWDAIKNFQATSASIGTTGSIAVTYFRGQG